MKYKRIIFLSAFQFLLLLVDQTFGAENLYDYGKFNGFVWGRGYKPSSLPSSPSNLLLSPNSKFLEERGQSLPSSPSSNLSLHPIPSSNASSLSSSLDSINESRDNIFELRNSDLLYNEFLGPHYQIPYSEDLLRKDSLVLNLSEVLKSSENERQNNKQNSKENKEQGSLFVLES